jgi:hypothetical protein
MRLARFALITAFGLGLAVAPLGCATPYSGKTERLKKPRKKKKPEPTEEEVAETEQVLDEKCRTNFFADPTTRRKESLGRSLAKQADSLLVEADEQEGQQRISTVKDALGKLENALKADPYGPEPTYKMAVAYAMVGKKGCAVALLERLQELTKHPDAGAKADRIINRALRDQSFEPFRKDADTALGR